MSSEKPNWRPISSSIKERHAAAAATIVRGVPFGVVMAGGRDSGSNVLNDAEMYEIQTNMWSPLPPMTTPRDGAAAAALNDIVMVVGGRGAFATLDSAEFWKLGSPRWEEVAPRMGTARSFCAAVAITKYNLIVVIGGRSGAYAELNSVEAFDLERREWRNLAPMRHPRMGCSAVVVEETKILVMGGLCGGEWLNSAEMYDLRGDSWTELPTTLPTHSGFHGATAVLDNENTYVVMVGGKQASQKLLEHVFCYSVELQKWRYLPNLSKGREGCYAATIGHTVKVFGGNYGNDTSAAPTRSAEELTVTQFIRSSWTEFHDDAAEVSVDSRQVSVHSQNLFQPVQPPGPSTATPEVVAVPIRAGDPVMSEAQVVQTTTEEPPTKQLSDDSQQHQQQQRPSRSSSNLRKVERLLMTHNGKKVWYTGQVNEFQKPQGKGIMWNDEDGSKYMGEWWDGMREGEGKTFFAKKQSMHYGSYHRDKRHGKGKFGWKDRRVYEGDFIEDRREGRGTLTWPDGTKYEGEFRRGGPNGMGQMTFADGTVYDGQFIKGKFDGFGVCHYSDGRVYRGEFREHKAHGTGKLTDANGTIIHIGLFIDDFPVSEN